MAKNRQIFAIVKATLFALVLSFSSLNAFSGDSCDFYLSNNSANCVVKCGAGYIVRQQGGNACITLNSLQNDALIEYMVISGYFNFLRKYPEYHDWSLYTAARSYLQKSGSTIKDLLYSSDHFVPIKPSGEDVCPVDSYKDLMKLNFVDDCKSDPSVGTSFWYMIHPNSMATSGDSSVKYSIYDSPILDYKYNTNGTVDWKGNIFVLNEAVEDQVKAGVTDDTELPPIALCPMGTKLTGVDKYVTSCNGVDTGASYDIIIYTDQTPFINAGITAGFGMDRFILREVFGKGWTAVIEDKNGVLEEIVLADYSNTSGIAQDKSLFYTYNKEIPLKNPSGLGLQDMLNAMFLAYEEFFTDQLGKDVKFNQTDKDAIINNLTQEKELHAMLNSSTFGRSTRLHANILYNNTAKSSEITYDNIPHHTTLTNFQCNSNCSGVEDTGNKERFDNYPEGGGEESTPTTIILNWNENGGNAITNGSCTYGSNLTLPSAPTRSGHTFNGWKLANGTIKGANTTVSGGCTSTYTGVSSGTSTYITAQWTASGGTGGGSDEPTAGDGQCNMQIDNPGCESDICMNNYKNTGFLQQENQWCYVNNYYFTDNNEYINPYTSIKNGTSGINYWSNSENDFVSLDVFHGEHETDLETSVLWENNHSFLSAGTTQIENKDDMGEYYELLNNIYNGNSDYDNTFVLPDLPYCDGYVFNGYDGGYDGAGVFVSCSGGTLTANYTSLDGTITIGSNSYELEHLSNIAPLALNLEEDPDATYRFVCDSSLYVLDYCNNQYVIDYLGNIHHSENEHGYAYISPLAVFMMAYEVPSSGSYFSGDCGGQTLMECFGINSSDGNLPNGGSLYDYSRESVEEFMKKVFEYDNWGFGVGGNSPQFAPDSRQYHLMKLANQYGIMGQNMVFENLGSGSGGGSTTPTTTTITLNWNENGGNAITNGSCTYGSNLTLPSAPTRAGYMFAGWKLADNSTHNAGETITGGCTSTHTGVSSGTSTYIVAQWTECGTGYYCYNGVKTQCPESYPNTDSDTVSSVADCYSVKTAACIKHGCVNPDSTGCDVVCADCSCAGSTYKQYANSDGTGDGVTEGNTIEACDKQISSLSAKPGYYVDGTSGCPICPEGYRDGTNAQNIYQCYGNSAVNCEDYYNIANAQTPYAPQSATCKMYYGSPTCVLNNKNACNISSLSCQNGYELTERDFDTSNPSLEYVKVKNTIVDNCYYENFSTQTNSSNCSDSSIFGTLSPGSWEVKNELGVIKGTAGCSETGGTVYQSGNPNITDSGNHCWCRIEKLNGETALSQWVYAGSDSSCNTNCQSFCGIYGFAFFPQEFRESLYSTVSQTCEEQTIIHCDAGWYLPAGQTQCVKCDGSSSTPSYQNIIKNDWCEGGDFQFSATDDQGLRACPTINDNTGAFSYELQYLGGSEHLDSDKNGMKDKITDCVASFMYTQRSEMISGIEEASSYNNNSELNVGTTLSQIVCFYDQTTGRYDNCILPTYVGIAYCNAGYKIKQSVLNAWAPLVDNSGNFVDGAYSLLIDMLSDPINPCELGEANHYTNLYDLLMASGDENSQQSADKFGVVSYHGYLYSPISDGLTNDITEMYKSCPTAYPNSNAGSWKVAQCYATVTFKDGNTVLKTENHDFSGSSDGVTVTSNPYHISNYEPTKAGYEFAGWYEESSGDSVTTSTNLTGNKTLYAKWLIKCPVVDNSSFGALRVLPDNTANSLEDCAARFMYANSPDNFDLFGGLFNGEEISADYDANNSINSTVYDLEIICKYNTITGLYDLCFPMTSAITSCARGYYIGNPEYELSLYNGDFGGLKNNDSHRSPCVPAERGYYTNTYDKSKSTGEVDEFTGVSATAYGSNSVANIFTTPVDMNNRIFYPNQDELYKKCPDAYPDSEPASWQVAQCYATVTFKDGNTVLKTENHDFSGSSDGTTVTSNPYHISNYEPNRVGYEFAGWYETSDYSTDKITTLTDLTGNKTLYAKWNLEFCGAGEYKDGNVCAQCPEGYRESRGGAIDTPNNINECRRSCTTDNIANSTEVTGKDYYGMPDTCAAVSCATHYHTYTNPNLNNLINANQIAQGYVFAAADGGNTSIEGVGITFSEIGYSSGRFGVSYNNNQQGKIFGQTKCSSDFITNAWYNNTYNVLPPDDIDEQLSGNCYCKLDTYAANSETQQNVVAPWVYYGTTSGCIAMCPEYCARKLSGRMEDSTDFITTVFNSLNYPNQVCAPDVYTVSFVTNGGETIEDISYTYGDDPIQLPQPNKDNYTFEGWYSDSSLETKVNNTYTPTDTITLYANWDHVTIHCDSGWFLPAGQTQCVQCTNTVTNYYTDDIKDNYWCEGGDFQFSATDNQGLRVCPTINDNTGAFIYDSDYIGSPFPDPDENGMKDKESDCAATFIYTSESEAYVDSTPDMSSTYNSSSVLNVGTAQVIYYCYYNQNTGHYDLCFPSTYHFASWCAPGYKIKQSEINRWAGLGTINNLSPDIEHRMVGMLSSPTNPCELGEANHYTNMYDLLISGGEEENASLTGVGAMFSQYLKGIDHLNEDSLTNDITEVYKSCPTEYPSSEAGSWKVAQCYATVTFKDGDTVLRTENHDFSGSSDGVTITSTPYHISNYQPTKENYQFYGWYETSDFSGNKITTETDLTGNKTLYAKWEPVTIHCDPGWYLPINKTECKKCENQFVTDDKKYWCSGGDFNISTTNNQGLQECPSVNDNTGAFWYELSSGGDYLLDPDKNNKKDKITDCVAGFMYTGHPELTGISQEAETYNPNSEFNIGVAALRLTCFYNQTTGRYDRCFTPTAHMFLSACASGYKFKQSIIDSMSPLVNDDGNLVDGADSLLIDMLSDPLNPCELGEVNHYTNWYDAVMAGNNEDNKALSDTIGVLTIQGIYIDPSNEITGTDITRDITRVYKQCPTEYPSSEAGSWKVAQCYATVTFKDGDTVLRTENHDFSGSSDGVTITSNPYHISDYEPTKDGYEFAGWYENADFSGNPITTSTDLTGNKTLYAKWDFYYRIGFNNNYIPGVTGSMDTIFVPYSQEITLPANQYSAPGYDFAGWCYAGEESGSVGGNPVSGFECMNNNKIDYVDEASVVSLTEYSTKDHYPYGVPIIKLYAQWTPHHYSIVFNANGGTGNMANQEFAYGTNQNLDANQFTKSDYEFAGWCTTQACADGDGHTIYSDEQSVGNLTTEDGAEINLYAQWTQNTFDIKYYSEGSELTEIMPDSYTYSDEDDQEFIPDEPTRSEFVFVGWCDNIELTGVCPKTITVPAGTTGNLKYYAKFVRQITIHFDANASGHETVTNIPENIVCTEGEACAVMFKDGRTTPLNGFSTKPYRIGHRFVSWNSDSEGQGASFEYEFQEMVTANTRKFSADLSGVFDLTDGDEITLYAQWEPEVYNIKYYSDDSVINDIIPSEYTYSDEDDQVITPDEPTKANYEFVGWCDNSGLTGDCPKTITVPAGTRGEITVYAKWLLVSCGNGEYKGDNVCELCPEGFREGTNAETINECYRSCTTANVLYSVNVTGLDYYDEGADTCEPTACENGYHVQDIASIIGQTWGGGYAHVNNSGEVRDGYMGSPYDTDFDDYEYHDASYYDLNTNDHNSFALSFGNKGVIRGHARCTTTEGTISYASYRFSTETSIKDEAGQIGARHCWCDLDGYRENNGTTWHNLYSNWIATYSMGGNSAEAAARGCAEYCVDQCASILSISDDDLPVYRATLFGSTKNICAPDVYNITYNTNGGTAIDSVEYTYGTPAITLPQPTRDNYTFGGWYSDSELQTFVGNTGDSYTPTESVTLYAQWSENVYDIKYYSDGMELNNIPQNTYTYNSSEDQTITPNEPVKANYEFVGWCDNSDLNGDCPKTITIPAGANGELHLYAKWEVGNFTITYELDGGAAENITSYTVETDDFVLNNPTKTGYVFQGWCEELHCAHPEHDYTFRTSVGGNRTMYAVFEPIQYTIEFNGTGAEGYKFAVTCEYDKNCDISNNGDFVYEGYDFVGWATTQNATVPQYPQTPTGITVFNLTDTPQTFMLYAMWSAKNIDLTYVYHNDADTVYSTSCVFDESVLPVVPVRPGFRFVGWRVNVGLDTLTQEQCTSAGFNWCVNGNGGVCQQNACM